MPATKSKKEILSARPVNVGPESSPSKDEPVLMAKYLEQQQQYTKAAAIYEKLLKSQKFRESFYQRLMFLYRKTGDLENELRIINAGIKAFQEFYEPSSDGKDRSVVTLSKKLNIMIGLTDKKGNVLQEAEPIPRWKKRRDTVKKKIEALSDRRRQKKSRA